MSKRWRGNSINASGFEGDKVLVLLNCDKETVKKVIDDANKPKYIIDSIVDDSDIFKVIKYHKEKNKTLVKLLKPLKPVKFFMGAYQSDDIKFG